MVPTYGEAASALSRAEMLATYVQMMENVMAPATGITGTMTSTTGVSDVHFGAKKDAARTERAK